METLKLVYLAIGPGIAIAVYLYFSDKWDPEPKKLVIKGFIWGAFAVFPTIYYEDAFLELFNLHETMKDVWWQSAFFAFFGVALPEELCKFFFLKEFIYEDQRFNEPYDGIVYGGVMGCGFATLENLMYVLPMGYETGIMRMYTAVPGHAFIGMILGYFMGRAKFSPNPWKPLTQGLAIVIVLHGTYDTLAFFDAFWSIYPVFGITLLGMYLGLKAKRGMEKTSKIIEFSPKEYFLSKGKKKQPPLTLKDLRDALRKGKVKLNDYVTIGDSDRKISIGKLLGLQIGRDPKTRIIVPPEGQPVIQVFIFYGLTFGLYLYFWFYRNYREFRHYKNLKLDPELRTLALFALTTIPYLILGTFLGTFQQYTWDPRIGISFGLMMSGIETAFLFFLFRRIKVFIDEKSKGTFNIFLITLVFFLLSESRKLLTSDLSYYWFFEFALILLQGGVLVFVQNHLNIYWETEGERLENTT